MQHSTMHSGRRVYLQQRLQRGGRQAQRLGPELLLAGITRLVLPDLLLNARRKGQQLSKACRARPRLPGWQPA